MNIIVKRSRPRFLVYTNCFLLLTNLYNKYKIILHVNIQVDLDSNIILTPSACYVVPRSTNPAD